MNLCLLINILCDAVIMFLYLPPKVFHQSHSTLSAHSWVMFASQARTIGFALPWNRLQKSTPTPLRTQLTTRHLQSASGVTNTLTQKRKLYFSLDMLWGTWSFIDLFFCFKKAGVQAEATHIYVVTQLCWVHPWTNLQDLRPNRRWRWYMPAGAL